MFPLADDNAGRTTTPVVTWGLIVLNVLLFLYQVSLGEGQMAFIFTWALQPNDLIHLHDLPAVLTSMFLHGGWMHLIGNMFFLHVFGDNLEDVMGHGRFLVFYLLCGLAAGAAQVVIDPTSQIPILGASGAIAGVLGGYIRLFPHGRVRTLIFVIIRTLPAWLLLGFWFLMNAWNAYQSFGDRNGGVAFMAHVGGFVAGFLLVMLFVDDAALARQRRVRASHLAMRAASRQPMP